MSSNTDPKILHSFEVTVNQTVPETKTENDGAGQPVTTTRNVAKDVVTRMAIRDLGRKERRAADLFHSNRVAHYFKEHGLLLASELTNRLINTTGGVLTDKEKDRVATLREKLVQLEHDVVRSAGNVEEKARLQREQVNIRTELLTLNAINEQMYAHTAEAKAAIDLSNWVTYHVVMIERAGRWVQYFEGDGATTTETFRLREEFMWKLDESADPFYAAAVDKVARYVYWFNKGADSAEAFKAMDEEMEKQRVEREAKEAAAKVEAEKPVVAIVEVSEPVVTS